MVYALYCTACECKTYHYDSGQIESGHGRLPQLSFRYPAQVMVLVTGLAAIASYSWRLLGSFGCPAVGSDGVWSFVQYWDYLVIHR
eukprot:2578293-Pyramimonas_sp.AAC.1